MFKVIAKLMDGSVERWEGIDAPTVYAVQKQLHSRDDVFRISVMLMY
jgi:hypothetical protein